MTEPSVRGQPLADDFAKNVKNFVVLCDKNSNTVIACYDGEYMGKAQFSIREVWFNSQAGYWCPGKGGIQLSNGKKEEFLEAIHNHFPRRLKL